MQPGTEYDERLGVPLRWWVQGTLLVASLWLALIVAIPATAAWAVTALALAVMAAGFLSYGRARVRVADGDLQAGRARIPVALLGVATALDADDTRRQAGRDADARAYLLLRPYLKGSVRVDLADPRDPTPYWLISSRRPEELAAVLARVSVNAAED